MTNKELIEDFFSHISDNIDYPISTERFWEKAFMDDKNYVIPYDSVCKYVRQIIKIPYGEFLLYVRQELTIEPYDSKSITQCSSFVACERDLCKLLIEHNNPGFSYDEIGKMLKGESGSDKEGAIRKYGENQIKTAGQLGLAFEYYDDWYLSILGYVYLSLTPDEQHSLLARTILRDRLYAKILCDLSVTDVDLLSYMDCISSESTKARRYGCVRFLVEICLRECKKDDVCICKIMPRRPFQKKNDEWIAKHYDYYTPIPVTNHENIPINVKRRAHIIVSNEGSARDRYLNMISAVPPMKSSEEKELILKGLNGDKASLDAVIESYFPIIHDLARIYNKLCPHADVQDLVGEGVLAVYESLSSYNPEYNTRLLSYAIGRIKLEMKIFASNSLIHIPLEIKTIINKVTKERSNFIQNNERTPSEEEMAEIMGISEDRVRSLNTYSSFEFVELKEDDFDSDTESDRVLMYESFICEISRALATLPPREAYILRKFYGIGTKEKTLEEIGDELHLTRERVRQIKDKALRKLNQGHRSHILMTYLGETLPSLSEIETHTRERESLKSQEKDEPIVFGDFTPVERIGVNKVQESVEHSEKSAIEILIAEIRDFIKKQNEWLENRQSKIFLTQEEIKVLNQQKVKLKNLYSVLEKNEKEISLETFTELKGTLLDLHKKIHCLPIFVPNPQPPKDITNTSRSGMYWTKEEEEKVEQLYMQDVSCEQIAKQLSRSELAIQLRLVKLGFLEFDEDTKKFIRIKASSEVLETYKSCFRNLKRSSRNGQSAPHKVILLLAIIALYINTFQQQTEILVKSPALIKLFDQYWQKNVHSNLWSKDINMPWKHMISEPFWHYDEKTKTTYIDKDLRDLLKDTGNRIALRNVLKAQLK